MEGDRWVRVPRNLRSVDLEGERGVRCTSRSDPAVEDGTGGERTKYNHQRRKETGRIHDTHPSRPGTRRTEAPSVPVSRSPTPSQTPYLSPTTRSR